ncbi:hypothetical protein Y1Q_0002195 [Alligator mississippiensis]|uniref:Uncharacterized protein n=1 Tax=Alligator mississippiensis TaxID=8496 RepID=A0A151MLF2_ALLMI|nr:hypothetical protein Y1Q_0002195 [Alligator mississippiensis]
MLPGGSARSCCFGEGPFSPVCGSRPLRDTSGSPGQGPSPSLRTPRTEGGRNCARALVEQAESTTSMVARSRGSVPLQPLPMSRNKASCTDIATIPTSPLGKCPGCSLTCS